MSGEAPAELRAITQKTATLARKQKALDKDRKALELLIVKSYKAGTIASTLAKAAGYSDAGLLKLLRRHGVEIRPRGRQVRTDVAYVERAGV